MNANLKSGLITLGIFAGTTFLVCGAISGIYKCTQSDKKIEVTDPQKAEQDIKTESDSSRSFFQAVQNIEAGKSASVENANVVNETEETTENAAIPDISDLCREIATYKSMNDDLINDIKNGNKAGVNFQKQAAERKKQEITEAFDELTSQPNIPSYVDNLLKEFQKYATETAAQIDSIEKLQKN